MIPKIESPYPNTSIIYIDTETFYYSYETCVAYSNRNYNLDIRLNKKISQTTSKHMSKLNLNLFCAIDEEEFKILIEKCQNSK